SGTLPVRFASVHLPHPLMWIPPLLLAILGLVWGCFPALVDQNLLRPAMQAMTQLSGEESPLKIWHGFNTVLLLSGITLGLGITLYWIRKPSEKSLTALSRFSALAPEQLIGKLSRAGLKFSIWYTQTLHNGYLRVYLLRIIVFSILLLAFRLLTSGGVMFDLSTV